MIQDAIRQVVEGKELSQEAAQQVMREMIGGVATQSQMGSFLTAMRMKGETEPEIRGFVLAMRDSSSKITCPPGAVDLCGTGGDGSNTFNISTVASFVVAGAGVAVAKHGNRSVSSKCGSSDLLAALGVPHDLPPAMVQECLDSCGLGFMFAPVFHQSMRNVIGPRREVGLRTFFNLIGPMANPAGVRNQLVGVYDPALGGLVARVLKDLGTERALVVNGSGTDECTTTGKTQVVDLRNGKISQYDIEPNSLGLALAEPSAIRGGTAQENARIAMRVLKGEPSSRSDIVVLNAGAGLYASGRTNSIHEGVEMAREAIASGKALRKAKEFAAISWELERRRQESDLAKSSSHMPLHPEILRTRARELTERFAEEMSRADSGRKMLEALDPGLLSTPNVLSVICLRRIKSIASDKTDEHLSAGRAGSRFSESVRSSPGIAVIAEYKARSPVSEPLSVPPDPMEAADSYAAEGANGVSVVVEPEFFSGSPELFHAIRSRIRLPMLFKDFVVDDSQIDLAERLGADAILLIAKALRPEALDVFADRCLSKGIEPLVEVHDEADIKKLEGLACYDQLPMIGVNSRDLRSLKTDLTGLRGLRDRIDSGKLVIAESGISSASDVHAVSKFDAVLVGSAFMRTEKLDEKVRELISACRSVAR